MRRSLAPIAVVLLILVGGAALLYTARALGPPTAAVSSSPSPTPTATAVVATTTPSATTTSSSSSPVSAALPGAERFAVIVDKGCNPPGTPPYVRREDRSEVMAPLGNGYLCQLNGAVSPDGRRLAYWHFESAGNSELALFQGGASSSTLVRLGDEFLSNVVWSADGTGLLFVAMKGGVQGVAPEYAALRTLDLASGSIQELTRVSGRYLAALAWDRSNRVTAAAETPASGGAGAYVVITEARVIKRNEMPATMILTKASPDATLMMALSRPDFVIRYWPLANFDDQKELRPAAGSGCRPHGVILHLQDRR